MRSLYARLFLSFWFAMLLVIAGSFMLFYLSATPNGPRRRAVFDDGLRVQAALAFGVLEVDGPAAAEARLADLEQRTGIQMAIVQGDVVIGADRTAESLLGWRSDAEHDVQVFDLPHDAKAVTWHRRRSPFDHFLGGLPVRLVMIALIAAILALLLARTLSGPLRRLREAAQALARGDLTARVGPRIPGATREVDALASDFDSMAEQLSLLVDAQQRLLRDVSHELRSPLARVQVAVGLARKEPDNVAHLDRIELEATRLGDLIGQILTLTRLGGPIGPSEDVDLAALLCEVVDDASYEASDSGRAVMLHADNEVVVSGSPDVIRWAVENVLRNAVRFTPERSSADVTLLKTSTHAVIEVRDHGPGVPKEELEAIFRPFYRVGTDRDRKTGGRGVGLAIAERAVRLHRGEIEAQNAPDGGLCVTIQLPLPRGSG